MSGSCDTFAGIDVPEGDPAALEAVAGRYGALAHAMSGVSGELRGMPGSMASWAGPASVSYAGACLTNGAGCDAAVEAMAQASHAARAYAGKLESAQERAKEAIADARDAQERIDRAEREIVAAQDRQALAAIAATAASTALAISAAAGTPSPAAEAARSRAEADGHAAAADEARARRELDRARDDLERAKRRGRDAEDDARDAGRAAAAAFAAAAGMSPAYAVLGGPANAATGQGGGAPSWWNTTNEGNQAWDEDEFLAQLLFFHPENDAVGRYKWWGDRVVDVGGEAAGNAAVAYGVRLGGAAVTTRTFLDVSYGGRLFVSGRGGTVLAHVFTATPTTATVIDPALLSRAGQWGRVGRAIPIAGAAISVGSAGWDQWREDSSNPNLTTTDRVGRATGVGMYVGGAAVAGAAVGTMIFPGVGTAAGLAIGAAGGLAAGAVASSITPVKEAVADAGQWTANAAVDSYNYVDDRLQEADRFVNDRLNDLGEGISDGVSDLVDDLPDVDLPDLNPF